MAVNAKNWQELKKPMGLERKAGGSSKTRATFVAEPLERGFGLTLGNALRSRSRTCCTNSRHSPASART